MAITARADVLYCGSHAALGVHEPSCARTCEVAVSCSRGPLKHSQAGMTGSTGSEETGMARGCQHVLELENPKAPTLSKRCCSRPTGQKDMPGTYGINGPPGCSLFTAPPQA